MEVFVTLVITAFNNKQSQQDIHLKCFRGRKRSVFSEIAVLVETVTNDLVIRK